MEKPGPASSQKQIYIDSNRRRQIGFILQGIQGNADGFRQVLVWHGFPGSALQAKVFSECAGSMNCQILGIDRPGFGDTTTDSKLHWQTAMDDAIAVVQSHGWTRFHVVGISGGAPYARAMAKVFPEQVLSLTTLGGLGSLKSKAMNEMPWFESWGLKWAHRLPTSALRTLIPWAFVGPEAVDTFMEKLIPTLDPCDQKVLRQKQYLQPVLDSFHDGLKQNYEGLIFDLKNFWRLSSPEYFAPNQPWMVWHGRQDQVVPLRLGTEGIAQNILDPALIKENHGHYTIPILLGRDILEKILTQA